MVEVKTAGKSAMKSTGKFNSRTPWSYRKGDTPLHRCSPGIKLIFLLLLSAAPLWGFPAALGAAALIVLGAFLAKLSLWNLLAGSRPLAIMLLAFAIFRIINIDTGEPPAHAVVIGKLRLDLGILPEGLYLAAGILVCFAAASLFFAVTTTMEIRQTLSRIESFLFRPFGRSSGRLSLSLALMLGFLPRFFECWENADVAARARGCTGGLRRVTAILPVVTERMIETAGETAEALESRGLEL